MKTYKMPYMGKNWAVRLRVASYANNGNLAIQIEHRRRLLFWERGRVLTVNLLTQLDPIFAYIDTNNMGDGIVAWLEKIGLAAPTGWAERSGFCLYPQMVFDENALKEADPVGYRKHIEQWSQRYGHYE